MITESRTNKIIRYKNFRFNQRYKMVIVKDKILYKNNINLYYYVSNKYNFLIFAILFYSK